MALGRSIFQSWRHFLLASALALTLHGCGDESKEGQYSVTLVNTTADITGPIDYTVRTKDEILFEGTLTGGGGCEKLLIGTFEETVEIQATTKSGLYWNLDVELSEGKCVEAAVDFTTARVPRIIFAIIGEDFIPAEIELNGEFIGTVTKHMTEAMAKELSDKLANKESESRNKASSLIEPIRSGQIVWFAPPPGAHSWEIKFPEGFRSINSLTVTPEFFEDERPPLILILSGDTSGFK